MDRIIASLFTAFAASLFAGAPVAQAQGVDYPARPIKLIVPFAAGGPIDIVGRNLAQAMGRALGQPVVVENKLGAGGTLAAGHVARAEPDGYTLLIHHSGMSTAPALYHKLAYNPLTDFEYVGQVVDVPMTLLGRKDLPANTLPELVAYLKANASQVNLAHAGPGGVSHLCGMLMRQAIGVELTTVPYQGTAPAMNALLGGQVDLLCDQTTQATQHIKAGNVKLYGVTAAERIKLLPEAPTLGEQGLKNAEVVVWHGVYAPKGVPAAVLEKVNAALRAALKDPAFVQHMCDLGAEVVAEDRQSPEALQTWLKSEVDRWGPVIRSAGLYAD